MYSTVAICCSKVDSFGFLQQFACHNVMNVDPWMDGRPPLNHSRTTEKVNLCLNVKEILVRFSFSFVSFVTGYGMYGSGYNYGGGGLGSGYSYGGGMGYRPYGMYGSSGGYGGSAGYGGQEESNVFRQAEVSNTVN